MATWYADRLKILLLLLKSDFCNPSLSSSSWIFLVFYLSFTKALVDVWLMRPDFPFGLKNWLLMGIYDYNFIDSGGFLISKFYWKLLGVVLFLDMLISRNLMLLADYIVIDFILLRKASFFWGLYLSELLRWDLKELNSRLFLEHEILTTESPPFWD